MPPEAEFQVIFLPKTFSIVARAFSS